MAPARPAIISGTVGGEIQLTDRLRADVGVRAEYDKYVQTAEHTSTFDLRSRSNERTFRRNVSGTAASWHFDRGISKIWSVLGGPQLSGSRRASRSDAAGARGYKTPALDDFLNATAEEQVDLFASKGGAVGRGRRQGHLAGPARLQPRAGSGHELKNVVSQGLVIDPVTGGSSWIIVPSPEHKSYGAEIEVATAPGGSNSWEALPPQGRAVQALALTSEAGSAAYRRRLPTPRPCIRFGSQAQA